MRSECKACTINKNVRYQRKIQAWKHRYVDNDEKRSYMIEYYAANKEKFAEYRAKFKERYPEYHKEYSRRRKNEKYLSAMTVALDNNSTNSTAMFRNS